MVGILGLIATRYLDAQRLELRRHRRVDVLVRAGDSVSLRLQHACERCHCCTADSYEMEMFLLGHREFNVAPCGAMDKNSSTIIYHRQ